MSTKKGQAVATIYEINFSPEQAAHISDLDVQIFWNTSHEGLNMLRTQLHMINGVYDVEYDMVNVEDGVTVQINAVNDTDEVWEQINKTVEAFLATPLAIEPAEEGQS